MSQQATGSQKEGPVVHVLPPLTYALDALEPYIDKLTMEIWTNGSIVLAVGNRNGLTSVTTSRISSEQS